MVNYPFSLNSHNRTLTEKVNSYRTVKGVKGVKGVCSTREKKVAICISQIKFTIYIKLQPLTLNR